MMPCRQRRLFAIALLAGVLGGCSTTQSTADATGVGGKLTDATARAASSVIGGPIIPDATISLGPSVAYPLEKLVYWGVWVGSAWLILDPLAPNWEIQEARFPENHVQFNLTMKRYYAGGAGEARVIFHRRAKELMRAGGFARYEVVEYAEGMESSMLGSLRKAEGVVRFSKESG